MPGKVSIRQLVKRAQRHLDAVDAARAECNVERLRAAIVRLDLAIQEMHAASWAAGDRVYTGERAFK